MFKDNMLRTEQLYINRLYSYKNNVISILIGSYLAILIHGW